MYKRQLYKKLVAWSLIAAMIDPTMMLSVYGRDSDIFLTVAAPAVVAEPNIMLLLDTSDTMNIPEPWREYPGAYDSHTEYLWSDTPFITAVSTAAPLPPTLTQAGSWAGATLAERNALRTAALNNAAATDALDVGVGARSTYRNYNDASWFYWLPAGTADTDQRLRSPSFNRWRGHINTIGGNRGGIAWTATTDYRGNNRCRDSGTDPAVNLGAGVFGTGNSATFDPADATLPQGLVPSTVFAPTGALRNSGRYLNQPWQRWERFLDVRNGKFADGDTAYPLTGVGATTFPPSGTFSIATSGSGTGDAGSPIRARTQTLTTPTAAGLAGAVRDTWPRFEAGAVGLHSTDIGDRGQPIRTQKNDGAVATVQAGDSRSGWTNPKADLGGFNYADIVNGVAPYTTAGVLTQVLSWYGITVGANDPKSVAWKGNRDTTPTYDMTVGTPAYVDTPTTRGDMVAGSTTVTLLAGRGASGITAGTIVNIAGAGPAGAELRTNVTAVAAGGGSMTVGNAASVSVTDAPITRNLLLISGGTAAVARCQVSYTLDADGAVAGNQGAFTATTNNDGSNTARFFVKAGAVCRAGAAVLVAPGNDCTGVVPTNKAPTGSGDYITARYSGCAWTGRLSLAVEGVGNYFYGGTCGAAATCRGNGFVSNGTECVAAGSATFTFGPSSYAVNNNCATSGLANLTAGVTQMAGAVLGSSTAGCGNRADTTKTCPVREGFAGCVYSQTSCPTDTFSTVSAPILTNHTVFGNFARDTELVHDCSADNNTVGNPSNSYITGRTDRLFNTAYNLTVNAVANTGAAYTGTAAQAATGPAIDTYSVNYLNWRFGPKGPNGAPIGRKTRLQIAKSAVADLVRTTDGVRFGLSVYNRVAGCVSSAGLIPSGTNALTLSDNPGFAVGGGIKVAGAGAAGSDLTTTITAITTNPSDVTFTLAASAATPFSTTGTVAAASNELTVPANPGFAIGGRIKVAGAGNAGADLLTTVAAIDSVGPIVITLSDLAVTAVAGASVTPIFDTTVLANPCSGFVTNDGGNIAFAVKRMGSNAADLPDFNNRAALIAAIDQVVAVSRTPLTETLYEIYRYYAGRTPLFGTSTAAALAGGTVTQGRDVTAVCAAPGGGCLAAGAYRSPMMNNPNAVTPAGCQKNFVIAINDGTAEDDWSANADIKRLSYAGVLGTVSPRTTIDAVNANTATDQLETGGVRYGAVDTGSTAFDGGFIWLDELAYFMSRADVSPGALNLPGDSGPDRLAGRQSIVTYTIGFAGAASPVLQNAAEASGGGFYVAEDAAALGAALADAIVAIRAFPAVFASPTVPISALNRAENATDVFLAFFKPDTTTFWLGTVKRFQLSQAPADCGPGILLCLIGQTVLTKAAPNPSPVKNIETIVVDPVSGTQEVLVDPNATSFWGPTNLIDGSNADQGGTGYQLLNTAGYNPSTRNVYTFVAGTSSTTDLTATSNTLKETNAILTKTLLGNAAMSDATRATLLNFARGGNAGDANCSDADSATACIAWRSWPHAAVEHSKPAVVTYNVSASPPTQSLYFLGSDGLLHAVDPTTGRERWSFLIEEALPLIAAQMSDVVGAEINVADGSLAVYQSDDNGDGIVNGADKVWLYFGLRRGGRAYYAIDVTDKDAPQFKWKITANSGLGQVCSGVSACVANAAYNELGQTWSTPQVGKVRALGTAVPALFFGGGYDINQDNAPVAVADTMGRAVYIVNGDTAQVLNWFGVVGPGTVTGTMSFSIPSDITALNTDSDTTGFIDRLYVGDMGGNLWRFDTDDATPSNWRGKKLADLSGSDVPKRKILFAPAAVKQDVPERFDAVYVGTGDREHPLLVSPATADDKIFMVMDRDVGLAMGATPAAVYPTDFLAIGNVSLGGVVAADLSATQGWFRDLDTGEKVVSPATVFFQKLRFGTYAPLAIANACTPAGQGRLNEINALTGDLFNLNTGDGLTTSDRYYAGFVSRGFVTSGQLIVQGRNVFHITVADARLQSILVGTIGGATKIYWYMEPEQ